jgi:hypothetical protein
MGRRPTGRSSPNTSIGLVANEAREDAVVAHCRLFEELGGAADSGERVLDFVRQHGGQTGDRTRRAARDELAVDLVGHGALLEGERHEARHFGDGAGIDVGDAVLGDAGGSDLHAVFGHRRKARAHALDKAEDGRTEGYEIGELLAREDG